MSSAIESNPSTQATDGFDEATELITLLRGSMTRRQLAESLRVSTSTVERWELGKVECKPAYVPALRELYFGTTHEDGTDFRTIDLFAGIGGEDTLVFVIDIISTR